MPQEANVVIYDLMVEAEPSYSGAVAFDPAADGLNVTALPEFAVNYQHAGDRPAPQGTEGKIKRVAPTGRTVEGTIMSEVAGAEATYSLSVTPRHHDLIQASGFSGSFESNSWVYKRNAIDQAYSVAAQLFARDTVRTVAGGLCDLAFTIEEAGATGMAEFTLAGIVSLPEASGTIPSITHPDENPPIATDIQFTIDGVTDLCLRSVNFQLQRDVSTPRTNANSSQGLCGIAAGRMDPILTVVVEANPATFDAYAYRDAATEFAASFTVGDTAYNTYAFSFPTCTIMAVNEQDDGPVAMWELVIDIHNSNPGNRDDIQWTFS